MKILALHVDYIKFKALKKALKSVESLGEQDLDEKKVDEALVILSAIENNDKICSELIDEFVSNIKNITDQVKTKKVVLYPYAHLSKNLGNPSDSFEILKELDKKLQEEGFDVVRAPFGYYKQFEMKVKGHPLSELSREIIVEGSEETYDPKKLLREISKSKLDASKLKENDHRILGKQMDLFSFNEVAPGMVFWHDNGLTIYNELLKFWREEHAKAEYEEIKTPQIMDAKLWKVSGHWDKYRENNFVTNYEKRKFLVKPMNCPGGMMVFKNSPKSYKDFPMRVGEIGVVHRCELSGVLAGLFRVIQFTQDDAHIFCTDAKQTKEEIKGVILMINDFYKKFNLEFDHVELSTRPEKRIGSDENWDMAEGILEEVLKEQGMKYQVNEGDGAFYGPKIDFHVKDSLGRTWQLSTIQVDFALPERFELEYTDKDNTKKRPIMLHRVIYGSLERFVGVLLEHTKGRLPVWIAPKQVRVLSFTDRNEETAKKILEKLRQEIPGLRIDSDFRQTTVPAKVKDAELLKIPYIIVIGDKEEKENKLAVRIKGDKKIQTFGVEEFIDKLKKEISGRE